MKSIAASRFKEQCLAILDSVDPEGIVITKHGKPVIGSLKGKIKIKGNILSTGLRWNAQSRHAHSPLRPDR